MIDPEIASPGNPRAEEPVIYVVEDDPNMLRFIAMALEGGPWRIKTFTDPEPAVRSFVEDPGKPSLLLTDYSMRSMDGLALGAHLKKLHKPLKKILMSGTTESEILDLAGFHLDGFVAKPFDTKSLLTTIRSVLRGQGIASQGRGVVGADLPG